MQINEGKFSQNGRCGYVLKPSFMLKEDFNPLDTNSSTGEEPFVLLIRVIAARHLTKSKRGIVSPYVEIELINSHLDTVNIKQTTKTVSKLLIIDELFTYHLKNKTIVSAADNGFNPVWDEPFEFYVPRPSLSFLRFAVYEVDMFSDANLIAQATYPVSCIRRGYRSVPLKNGFSEYLELAALLIHMDIRNQQVGHSS